MPDVIGAMDKRVSIHRAAAAAGVMGRKVGERVNVGTVWAYVRSDAGTTAIEGQVPVDRCDLVITLRWLGLAKTITIEDRIRFPAETGDQYRILTIPPANRLTGRITFRCVREAR